MKDFIRQNLIRIAIGVISLLIILSAGLSYYNNKVMSNALVLKEQSNFALREVERVYQNIQLMDISSRGYALIREQGYLFWSVQNARDRNAEIFHNLDSIFALQHFENPEKYAEVKKGLDDYTNMYAQMVAHLQASEDSLYEDLLRKDLGRYFWEEFNPFSKHVNEYEAVINQQAQASYEQASLRNIIVQLLLVLVGIPTMIFVGYRLAKDEQARKALLQSVADNNQKYLFNDGRTSSDDAKLIIDNLIHDLQEAATFVNEISSGNYNAEWQQLNGNAERNKETLAGRLVYMRDEMRHRKEEDNKRIWVTEGLSDLSQLIREFQNDTQELTFRSLTFLVKYIKAQQGSLFVLTQDETDEPYLKLHACYAFNRKIFIENRVNIGEGLIGQVFLERETTLLRTVPAEYLTITSGLGDAPPHCVVLIPMKYNDAVLAVLELAAFRVPEQHEITFLEKAGEFIASAMANVQNNERNKTMIEQMRSQTDQLRAQEEALRQNLEELEATQENMRRSEIER